MTSFAVSLEPAIIRIGTRLSQLSAGRAPTVFEARWWSQGVINLAMKDPAFKVQLFRFIDVLPALVSDQAVVKLAEEYWGARHGRVFGLQWGMKALTTSLGTAITGKSIRHQVEQMARTFIAGGSVAEALPVLAGLWKEERAWSVDLLGEATISNLEADQYRDRCLAALSELAQGTVRWPSVARLERDHLGFLPRVQLSLKISALTSRLDPIDPDGTYRAVAARLRPIVDLAAATACGLIFDMEQAESKDLLLDIFRRLFTEEAYRSFAHAGVAMQAYHRETERDVRDLIAWADRRGTPITIRLVKGAYWDSDTVRHRQAGWPVPLFEQKFETDANYEALIPLVLQHRNLIRPAFGTHNLRTLAVIEAVAESLAVPPEALEYQMIYGMAEPFQHAMVAHGRRVRLYTPVGRLLPGMAYLVRRLLENTSNESFLRKEYVESQSLSTLLAPSVVVSSSPITSSRVSDDFLNEPHCDFSKAASRAAMQEAIGKVRSQTGRRWESPHRELRLTGPLMESRNPARPGEVVALVPSAAFPDVAAAVDLAVFSAAEWRRRPVAERVAVMRHAAALMRERRKELAAWEIIEVGKPWREADGDVAEAIDFLEFYARHMDRLAFPLQLGHYPGERNHRVYAPRGVAAVIAPWNFPLAIPTGMVSAALVAGNAVVFKPSERAPLMGRLLTDILHEAGVPSGALICVPGGPEIGRALAASPEISTIAFTGSKDVGLRLIAGAAAVQPGRGLVKRVIAEMGGKNAIIVDDTADLDEAIAGVVTSFTGYAGQKCSACSRAIVLEGIYDQFLSRLHDAVMSLTIGDPLDPGTQVGPVIDAGAKERIEAFIAMGQQEGRLLVRRSTEGPGYFVGPTVFADVLSPHRVAQEEIFGPVLAVMKAATVSEALEIANSTSYALTGGIYSRSPVNLALARERFDVGNLYVNRPITGALVGRQPFGGHRLSGVGAKAGGDDYLQQFMIARVISENTLRRGFEATD